jgi:hypothetical protein
MSLLEVTREQSRLIFNGPVGCYKQLAGLFNADNYMLERSRKSRYKERAPSLNFQDLGLLLRRCKTAYAICLDWPELGLVV